VSGLSHHAFRNVSACCSGSSSSAGIVGAVIGAYILSSFPGDRLRPYIAGYLLLMGAIIV